MSEFPFPAALPVFINSSLNIDRSMSNPALFTSEEVVHSRVTLFALVCDVNEESSTGSGMSPLSKIETWFERKLYKAKSISPSLSKSPSAPD